MRATDSQTAFRANEVNLSKVCAEIQARIAKNRHIIFLLQGDIGAGKTTLVREFAKRIGIKDSVTSPTFSLLHIYEYTNQSRDSATKSRPIRGAKNREQGRSSASADFLLESEKRGTPPKSEKRQLLARRGSGAGGAALLRKEKGESQSQQIVGDSQVAKMDSSLRATRYAQNDESFVDCHESLRDSRNDGMGVDCFGDESPCNDEKNSKIYHYDLYQKGVDYAIDLGLLDLLEQSGIHFVEWGDSQLFGILKNAFENICIISIHKTKNDRIYEFKESF